jgi:hypothetical protein
MLQSLLAPRKPRDEAGKQGSHNIPTEKKSTFGMGAIVGADVTGGLDDADAEDSDSRFTFFRPLARDVGRNRPDADADDEVDGAEVTGGASTPDSMSSSSSSSTSSTVGRVDGVGSIVG